MKYGLLFVLVSFFITRIIVFSASYADAICLIAVLSYKFGIKFMETSAIYKNTLLELKKSEEETNAKLQALSDEIVKVKNSSEALKAAVNFNKR
jgi:hypothetical protein